MILYYRGSDLDVEQIDPPLTIKEGDSIQIGENILDPYDREQFERVVKKIVSEDIFDTFPYDSLGINTDSKKQDLLDGQNKQEIELLMVFCIQKEDLIWNQRIHQQQESLNQLKKWYHNICK